ncbi:DUF6794 domain-containing protein [Pontibacter sp. H249]|uniref:DUF6794 domain-containing protein n=1 Tax=Pontibacter sp. H249 TaxID=3133420 RepID=UPI0030BAB1D7
MAQDKARFFSDSINGVYIPKNLEESLKQIDTFWNDSTKQEVAEWTEDELIGKALHGFGTWIRNNWGLWGGSRLSEYFHKMGVHHPDDMSGIILTSYHRKITGKPLEVQAQVQHIKQYWKKAEKEEKELKQKAFKEFSKGDTVEFSYYYEFISSQQEDSYMNDLCEAYGVVINKNKKDLTLLVKLLRACDENGIVVARYSKADNSGMQVGEEHIELMQEGEKKWLDYSLWHVK